MLNLLVIRGIAKPSTLNPKLGIIGIKPPNARKNKAVQLDRMDS